MCLSPGAAGGVFDSAACRGFSATPKNAARAACTENSGDPVSTGICICGSSVVSVQTLVLLQYSLIAPSSSGTPRNAASPFHAVREQPT